MEARRSRVACAHASRTSATAHLKRPQAKVASAGTEERMMILRMGSKGKISVEQADQLLAAMDG